MSRQKFTIADIFGTPGGLSLGFEMAGFKSLGVLDNDLHGIETYRFNFPKADTILMDARKEEAKRAVNRLGDIDVIVGGPPCEGFSLIGRIKIASLAREGVWKLRNKHQRFISDPRNDLYKEFVKIVSIAQPKVFVMENVPGMMSYRDGEVVEQIKEDFKKIGYRTDVEKLDADLYGVPQRRSRVIFIGNRFNLPNRFPEPMCKHCEITFNANYMDGIHSGYGPRVMTVWDAIGDLPELNAGEGSESVYYTKDSFSDYQKWARRKSKVIWNHVARYHRSRDIMTFTRMHEGEMWKDLHWKTRKAYGYNDKAFRDKMKKMYRFRPGWTVQSHLCKDGYLYIHPTQLRTITVREAARLQSFPDHFIFKSSRVHQFHQVGRAVPPLLAKAIAHEVKKMLESV